MGEALLSEVSMLFKMLMTQKADIHPGPHPNVLCRLSAAYHHILGLDTTTAAAENIPNRCAEKRPTPDTSSPFYH